MYRGYDSCFQGHTEFAHKRSMGELSHCLLTSLHVSHVILRSIQNETKICKHIDPWAGSYYVESLTNELAHKAWEHIQEIEKQRYG